MLAHILAVLVGTGSVGLYISAFFFPEIHRKQDFIWSGVGFLYALTLWIYARQVMGGILVGQISSVALIGWFGWQTLKLRQQLAPVSPQSPIAGTTKLRERLGLNRSTAKATKPTTAPTPAKTTEPVTPPQVKNPIVQQPSANQKTAPVESNLPSTKNSIVQPVPQRATSTQSVPLAPPKNPSVQPSVTPKTAPVESDLPPAQPETEQDLAPTLRVDVVESTEKAWIKLEVKSSPATKPLGTAVKPPTPLLLSAASNPDPQPPAIVAEDLATMSPTEAISAKARLDAEDWE
ncbi:Ycf66 family protein [Chamaesiphon sp.]|uniref:Ycf66 family protein n=1 Tax=Chamaesiphon sp. TaxID=2814140 RepID=UPI003594465D